jgi:apolipoprotein N-acyltransferase
MIALAFYCALYFIPFAVFVSLRRCAWRSLSALKNLGWIVSAAAVWTACEYLRAVFITGFPWNLLGVSQYTQLPLIQLAEWGGVYAVSFLMVFVNAATASTVLQYASGLRSRGYRVHLELMSALLLVAFVWALGFRMLLNPPAEGRPVCAALIQPDIPEVGNWELADPELIYHRLEKLTALAQRFSGLDLILWPETALPDFVRYSERSADLVKRLAAAGTPLLAGSMDLVWRENGRPDYYNASMLFNPRGELLRAYYKQHLVLFGEYIPFDEKIPLVNALTPISSSFRAGEEATLFHLPGDPRGFSVLICFEDTVPYLARRAVRAGATWLVNQTNDSWFDPDCGSQQHLVNAVFRCIETRRPMFRCTNTGATCTIDAQGRIIRTLAPRTEGFQIAELVPADPAQRATFYVRFGDLFAQACLLGSVAVCIVLLIRKRKTSHA